MLVGKITEKVWKVFLTTETIYDTSMGSMLDYCYYYLLLLFIISSLFNVDVS